MGGVGRASRVAVVGVLLLLAACGGSGDTVSKSTFKGDWPLTVDAATIACGTKNKQSVGVTVNGTTYALNGTAKTWEKWPDLEPVWDLNKSVGDLIDYARSYCVK